MKVAFDTNRFEARQAEKDETVQLPHVTQLVPRGDWILQLPNAAGELGPVLVLANVQFRALVLGSTPEDHAEIESSIPEYVPGPPAPAEDAPAGGVPELGPADA